MDLFQTWIAGVARPVRAFEGLRARPAPAWGFWVVLVFNLLISATTLLAQVLLGRPPIMESWLTFLPDRNYLLAEVFFLPPLRILVWLAGAAIVHLGIRLANKTSDFDLILNMGGLGTLVVMPFILVSDWLLIAWNVYPVATYTHPLAALWGMVLTVIGLRLLFGTRLSLAIVMTLASTLATIPLLAIFAR